MATRLDFSNFGSLKSTETVRKQRVNVDGYNFSNFGSLKSTETEYDITERLVKVEISAISAR